jgi:hypothetical protein
MIAFVYILHLITTPERQLFRSVRQHNFMAFRKFLTTKEHFLLF